ncbi:MAG: non-homologous end-joining DNA ligase, partial [Actinomycetota bacterium]
MARTSTEVTIARRKLKLSNLDKVMYPATGFTKGDAVDYYRSIAQAMLPHIKDRAVTLKRFPDGVDEESFFEKQCPRHRPQWIRTVPMSGRRKVEHCLLNTEAALVWVANLASLELHVTLAKRRDVTRPRVMVFDLDPGPPADIVDCAEVGLEIRDTLDDLGLRCLPKTSGSKGLQIYVPLNRPRLSFDATKSWAHSLATLLADRHPDRILTSQARAKREGKVLVDWGQNDTHKTTVCAYSLRAKQRPTVSTPVTWEEVRRAAETGRAELLS